MLTWKCTSHPLYFTVLIRQLRRAKPSNAAALALGAACVVPLGAGSFLLDFWRARAEQARAAAGLQIEGSIATLFAVTL